MKYLILTIFITVLLFLGNSSKSLAQTTLSASEESINTNGNDESSFVFLTKADRESNLLLAENNLKTRTSELVTHFEDELTVWTSNSSIVITPSTVDCQAGCTSDDCSVKISGGIFGNGWDITKVTLNGVEVLQILIQSSNEVVVVPKAGTAGTGDVVITSTSLGKTIIKNGITYSVNRVDRQASNH